MNIKFVKFSQILDFQKKSQMKAGEGLANGTFPFFTSSSTLSKYTEFAQFSSPSIIFGTGGSASVHVCDQPFSVSTDCLVAQIKPELSRKFVIKFIYYYLFKNIWILEKGFKGAGLRHISKSYINDISIPEFSPEDQKRIVKILDSADALRQKRKQAITLLDNYLQSVFIEMFGDPSTNPKGWERKKIGDYFLVQGGFAFKSSDYRQNGIKLVKIANVHFEDLTWDPIEYVSEQLLERQSEFLLKQNDFLIALTRPIIQSLGVVKTATVKQDDLPCLLNQRVARFKAKKISLNPEFLKYFCYSPFFKRMVEYYSTSALQPNISTKEVEEILIFNPPKELQNHFSAIARKTESIKHKMLIQSQELEMGFQALMQKAFKGEL